MSFSPKKIDNFLGQSKLNFWTKNEDFEQYGTKNDFCHSVSWLFTSLLTEKRRFSSFSKVQCSSSVLHPTIDLLAAKLLPLLYFCGIFSQFESFNFLIVASIALLCLTTDFFKMRASRAKRERSKAIKKGRRLHLLLYFNKNICSLQ